MNSLPHNFDFPYNFDTNMHMFDEFERVIFQRDLSFTERKEEPLDLKIKFYENDIKHCSGNQARNFTLSAPMMGFGLTNELINDLNALISRRSCKSAPNALISPST